VRTGIAQVADHAHRYAERQWHKRQAEAGVAVLDWFRKNPESSFLAIPSEVRDWLAPDQWQGLENFYIGGRLKTDRDLFERLDRQMVHDRDGFAAVDLDRHRLSLGDADHTRFAGAQKAIAEGRIDPDLARYDRLRTGLDRELEGLGIDPDGPVATACTVRRAACARRWPQQSATALVALRPGDREHAAADAAAATVGAATSARHRRAGSVGYRRRRSATAAGWRDGARHGQGSDAAEPRRNTDAEKGWLRCSRREEEG